MNNSYKEYEEDEFLMISGIQHFVFCKRQWALIHIEQQWEENYYTVDGNIMHERVHNPRLDKKRKDISHNRGMQVCSRSLGMFGVCDMVEFHEDNHVVPIEYKRGKPKDHKADIMQLVLQTICLEEMLCTEIENGYIFYGETKHREKIEISKELRDEAKKITEEMHELFNRGYVPKVKIKKECKSCSLQNICLPKLLKIKSAKMYIDSVVGGE